MLKKQSGNQKEKKKKRLIKSAGENQGRAGLPPLPDKESIAEKEAQIKRPPEGSRQMAEWWQRGSRRNRRTRTRQRRRQDCIHAQKLKKEKMLHNVTFLCAIIVS